MSIPNKVLMRKIKKKEKKKFEVLKEREKQIQNGKCNRNIDYCCIITYFYMKLLALTVNLLYYGR